MSYKKIQSQYDKIYSYFKSTTEPFDFLEWDGKNLVVWYKGEIIEQYSLKKLAKLVFERI
jgi:hypothetical protein